MKVTIKNIVKESELSSRIKFLNTLVDKIKPPYVKEMSYYGVTDDKDIAYIFSKLFNVDILVKNFIRILYVVDKNDVSKTLYSETLLNDEDDEMKVGEWDLYKYEDSRYPDEYTYFIDSDGKYHIRKFNDEGKIVYIEDENGVQLNNDYSVNESYYKKPDDDLTKEIADKIPLPYIKELNNYAITDEPQILKILSYVFGKELKRVKKTGGWFSLEDEMGRVIYAELTDTFNSTFKLGTWVIFKYEDDRFPTKWTYQLQSNGETETKEYSKDGSVSIRGYGEVEKIPKRITESADKKERYLKYIVKSLLDNSEYEIQKSYYVDRDGEQRVSVKLFRPFEVDGVWGFHSFWTKDFFGLLSNYSGLYSGLEKKYGTTKEFSKQFIKYIVDTYGITNSEVMNVIEKYYTIIYEKMYSDYLWLKEDGEITKSGTGRLNWKTISNGE